MSAALRAVPGLAAELLTTISRVVIVTGRPLAPQSTQRVMSSLAQLSSVLNFQAPGEGGASQKPPALSLTTGTGAAALEAALAAVPLSPAGAVGGSASGGGSEKMLLSACMDAAEQCGGRADVISCLTSSALTIVLGAFKEGITSTARAPASGVEALPASLSACGPSSADSWIRAFEQPMGVAPGFISATDPSFSAGGLIPHEGDEEPGMRGMVCVA